MRIAPGGPANDAHADCSLVSEEKVVCISICFWVPSGRVELRPR